MLSRFSDPPRVVVPSACVGFLLSQSCSSPSLLYISPIHSSSPTTNCFILLRPTFFTLDQRFWLFSRPAHQTRSLCSSIPPLHSLIHRHLGASQWQSTFPPPPHLMDSHLHGKHWVHFLWGARIEEEEEWILKPRTGNIWLVLSLKELQNDQGGRVSETSLPSFGQLQVNASIFLRQTLSICIISLVLILDMWLLSFLTKVLQHKPFNTVYTPFSLKTYCQWQFVTQIFLIWKNRLY